jgi:hypothetical protein
VSISNVTVSGSFVVSSNCGSSVAANGSCAIYVYFAPTLGWRHQAQPAPEQIWVGQGTLLS